MFVVIDDMAQADALAKAGLLWYGYPAYDGGKPATWETGETEEHVPSVMQARYNDYTFYILTEE